jgi:hypothetical protein
MGSVTGLTAGRMLAIEAESITGATVDAGGNLILSRHDGTTFSAGKVKGADGTNGTNATALLNLLNTGHDVALTKTGSGTVADPWVLSGDMALPPKLMQLAPGYIGPGPAMVTDVGTGLGTQYGPYEWEGAFNPMGNVVVRLAPRNGTYVITGHAEGNTIGGWRSVALADTNYIPYSIHNVSNRYSPFSERVPAVKTPAGIVVMQGLFVSMVARAANDLICTLPPDMWPDTAMIFPMNSSDTTSGITVNAIGEVRATFAISAGSWIDLTMIAFPAAGVATWSPITAYLNSFADYGVSAYGVPRYWVDPYGICWFAGLLNIGSATANTPMFTLPTAITPTDNQYEVAVSGTTTFTAIQITGSVNKGSTQGSMDYLTGSAAGNWLSLAGITLLTNPGQTTLSPLILQPWLANSWVPFGAAGAGNLVPMLAKRADGLVMTFGLMKSGTIAAAAFMMPERFLPKGAIIAHTVSNRARGRIDITGQYTDAAWRTVNAAQGSNVWYSLDGMRWYAGA